MHVHTPEHMYHTDSAEAPQKAAASSKANAVHLVAGRTQSLQLEEEENGGAGSDDGGGEVDNMKERKKRYQARHQRPSEKEDLATLYALRRHHFKVRVCVWDVHLLFLLLLLLLLTWCRRTGGEDEDGAHFEAGRKHGRRQPLRRCACAHRQ